MEFCQPASSQRLMSLRAIRHLFGSSFGDMLVEYSSSSEEEEEKVGGKRRSCQRERSSFACKKRKCEAEETLGHNSTDIKDGLHIELGPPSLASARLPLPKSVVEMFQDSTEQVTEDRSLHGGRVRSFQHERGNWATYLYLPYMPEDGFLELLDEMMQLADARGISLTRSEEFHLSMSQTVVLRHHWIQPFVLSLRMGLAQCPRFLCVADRVKVYTNQEKSRTFLGMEVSAGHAQLLDLVRVVDQTMEEFSLSTFYQDPSFHISLAWCVGDSTDQLRECLQELQDLVDSHEDGPFLLRLPCQELRCKAGNKIFSFHLH
ncbi:U6 snRNA phosphodiesterase 1 isoform X1 [Scleropages formosus]|uniref:U6 snRNA phosphodiesterase n=2 Tax=Scleropages formosus TaxID=113540 RepID=A0A8C9SM17_SCLFO|nr:U6 snRNA phosphodiesterase isoform X1 [Scleropages formosus]XP_018594970.2 U6 snRNA phosphodiesterase isoform X1 [Scleropages formosus]